MDMRCALKPGTLLRLRNRDGGSVSYTIREEIGRGGSSIVYDAVYTTNADDTKTIRIKECYPFGLHLSRQEDGQLIPSVQDQAAFREEQTAFKEAFQRNNKIFANGSSANYVANTLDWYEANGTCYIVTVYLHGETLSHYHPERIAEAVSLCTAAAKAVQRIHQAGYLYLDLKPENIFVIDGTTELVQLFDFDSLFPLNPSDRLDDKSTKISFTKGYAALELQQSKLAKLAPYTDVYSLGAVLFQLLFSRLPNAFDCSSDAVYDWSVMHYSSQNYPDRLIRELQVFFRHTLASYPADRYQTMDTAIKQLGIIAQYAAEKQLFLASTYIAEPAMCIGREEYLFSLGQMLQQNTAIHVYGMGGIGKSTLVRRYIRDNQTAYDSVLWLYWTGDIVTLINDDRKVKINTVKKDTKETTTEYYERKLQKLREITAEQNVLIIIDDFDPSGINGITELMEIGCKVILISRRPLPEGILQQMTVPALESMDAMELLAYWSDAVQSKDDERLAAQIVANTAGHTLLLELIGKQIAAGRLTLQSAAKMSSERSLSASNAAIDYVRDFKYINDQMNAILEALIRVGDLSKHDRTLLKMLSMFDHNGIATDDFAQFSGYAEWDELESLGWIECSADTLSLHPITADYFAAIAWDDEYRLAAEHLMENLYTAIHPTGDISDTDKQFPAAGDALYGYLNLASQIVRHHSIPGLARSRLLYHLVMDSPVDQDEQCLLWADDLISNPCGLQAECVSKIFSEAALLSQRMDDYDLAKRYLEHMRSWLIAHPSMYYWALWYNDAALSMWNCHVDDHERKSLDLWNRAIPLARCSRHPRSKLLLAECLLHKATSILDLLNGQTQHVRIRNQMKCSRIMNEVTQLMKHVIPDDSYEAYQYWCIASHYFAQLAHDDDRAFACMTEASRKAWETRDSDMAWIDHLYDECFTLNICLGYYEEGKEILKEAIALCEEHVGVKPYDRKREHMTNCLLSMEEE